MWTYDGDDPGIRLFTTALEAGAPMPLDRATSVLEVGSCETDWLRRAAETWPAWFVGLDWREPKSRTLMDDGPTRMVLKGNALQPDACPAGFYDAIVSLSAIEHMGLGHYDHDPLDEDGDFHVLGNCWSWLKPGGWLYFDVPYDPRGYRVCGTEYRTYDTAALEARLRWPRPWRLQWTGYAKAWETRALIERPTDQPDDRLHYYVAMVLQKPDGGPQG